MVEALFHSVLSWERRAFRTVWDEEADVLCTKGMSSRVRYLSQPSLVISSAGQGRVSRVIAHREGTDWSQQMPAPIAASTGDLVVPWVMIGSL